MSIRKSKSKRVQDLSILSWFSAGVFLVLINMSTAWAANPSITALNFSSLSGNKVQIQLGMDGPAIAPKVFQTDNPSRIALDFAGVKSALDKKMYAVNQGAANTVYVVEVSGRTRVVINLSESVPYETKVDGNNVYVVLKAASTISSVESPIKQKNVDRQISNLLPEQTIKNIDFRRGPKGEGRLLIELTAPNTVVDVKERAGKIVLNFLNTKLPNSLVKSFDVSDFATPVQKISAQTRGSGVNITVTPVDGNYDYSSYQSDGLLTIDFMPLSMAEKEALLKEKFPYTGNKLSLNFQAIEVRSVLQILADFTELNIIAADSVGGTVTLRLNDVPWDQALDLILKSKGLAKRQTGNVVLVAPSAEIVKIEREELAAKKVVEQLEPLRTEYIQINYAKAEDFKELLTSKGTRQAGAKTTELGRNNRSNDDNISLISPRGTVIVDSRTNTLIVKDTASKLDEIQSFIQLLDVPVRQVLIESRIVIASTNFAQNLGVKFGVAKSGYDVGGDHELTAGAGGVGTAASTLDTLATALSASSGGALAMTLARGADYVLNLEIRALQDDVEGELLSNPRVMTTDRVQATIKQGVQIPYQTSSQDGPVTELVDAVLELDVTPQITPSGSVIMELNIKKDAPGAPLLGGLGSVVPIDTAEVNTTVQVQDGETIVLGGIYEGTFNDSNNKVPWLADLPAVGWMFKAKQIKRDKKELLIFVTPKIVKNTLSAR